MTIDGAHAGQGESPTVASNRGGRNDASFPPAGTDDVSLHSRRAAVRLGVKLAFVAPVLSTFFAGTVHAGTRERSCLKRGSPCAGNDTWCCGTDVCDGVTQECVAP